jgi:hypothetical protein
LNGKKFRDEALGEITSRYLMVETPCSDLGVTTSIFVYLSLLHAYNFTVIGNVLYGQHMVSNIQLSMDLWEEKGTGLYLHFD